MTKDERRMFMKIKKLSFLSLFLIIGLFLFMPNFVNAADDSVYSLDIITEDLIVDEPFPSTVKYIFEISNETKEFELNCFWLLAEGETQVPEGAVAENEVEYIPVADPGNLSEEEKYEYTELLNKVNPTTTKIYYNNELLDFTNGIMTIKARNKVTVTFNANGGTINGNAQYVIEDYIKGNALPTATRAGYYLKDWYTKPVGGMRIINPDQLYDGIIVYAHWEKEGLVTIDFANMDKNEFYLSGEESLAIDILVYKGLLNSDTRGLFKNKDGKILLSVDLDNTYKVDLPDDLTVADNIILDITPEEKEQLRQEFNNDIPDRIELIVSTKQVVKIIFDANGGVFKNNITTIDIEDIINFDYDAFEKPTRKGYKFIGFYTKDGSKSYLDVNNSEAGFEEDTTFYAKWEETSTGTTTNPDVENPKTFDSIGSSIFMGTISLIGLVGATIYLKKRNKVRA